MLVRLQLPPPNLVCSYNGHYCGLSIRLQGFDSPTDRQIVVVKEMKMNINDMVGKVFTSVTQDGREMVFANDTERFKFLHWQDCCESVYIESVVGDLSDLEGEPLLIAEEVSGEIPEAKEDEYIDSRTWTFYKFATRKGYVDVRWLGESNGYYSESVDLEHELI